MPVAPLVFNEAKLEDPVAWLLFPASPVCAGGVASCLGGLVSNDCSWAGKEAALSPVFLPIPKIK